MRKCSTVFTWIGGILSPIILIVRGFMGVVPTEVRTSPYSYYTKIEYVTPGWLWAIFIALIVLDIIGLIWREVSLRNGKKIGCGIFTIIFVSKVGGILTLCIPDEQLY